MAPQLNFFDKLKRRFGRPPAPPDYPQLPQFEEAIGHRFRDPSILIRALSHRSYSSDGREPLDKHTSNERLEFLGDAVLSLVVNEFLYKKYPRKREGSLTKMKSVIVSKAILSHYAKRHDLGSFLLLSENAQRARVGETDSVLADGLEAVFGAVFLDGGFEAARHCIRNLVLSDLDEIFYNEDNINYKSLLQEYIQALHKVPPKYRVSATTGPEHDKEFNVEVVVRGQVLAGGIGKTKKLGEQEAAKIAYKKLLNTSGVGEDP